MRELQTLWIHQPRRAGLAEPTARKKIETAIEMTRSEQQ